MAFGQRNRSKPVTGAALGRLARRLGSRGRSLFVPELPALLPLAARPSRDRRLSFNRLPVRGVAVTTPTRWLEGWQLARPFDLQRPANLERGRAGPKVA